MSLRTVGSAFSWIRSEAEVWRQKMVRRPVWMLCWLTHSLMGDVIS